MADSAWRVKAFEGRSTQIVNADAGAVPRAQDAAVVTATRVGVAGHLQRERHGIPHGDAAGLGAEVSLRALSFKAIVAFRIEPIPSLPQRHDLPQTKQLTESEL